MYDLQIIDNLRDKFCEPHFIVYVVILVYLIYLCGGQMASAVLFLWCGATCAINGL